MSFDHHDDEIEQMMWERAHRQGSTLIAANPVVARHHERMDDPAYRLRVALRQAGGIDAERLLQVITETMDAFNRVIEHFNEAMVAIGTSFDEFAKKIADIMPDRADGTAPIERLRHGHAAVCPKHGPTTGGFCRRCAR